MKFKNKEIKFNIYIFFVLTAMVWGLVMSIMIPVSQVPDEYTHFEGMLASYGNKEILREDMDRFFEPSGMSEFNQGNLHPVDSGLYMKTGMESYSKGLFEYGLRPSISAIKYLPIAIGFYFGVLLHLPMIVCHQLGELTALIFYIIFCVIALKKMPFKKEVMLFVMLLPMAIQEAGSFSPDVVVNACSFLITAMILDFRVRDKKVGWKDIIVFALLSLWILIAKMIYVLIPLGIFIVPLDKFELKLGKKIELAAVIKRFKPVFIGLIILMVILVGYICRDFAYFKVLYACILQPGNTFSLFKNTFLGYGDLFIQTLVGSFGWLEIDVSLVFIVIFFIMLFYINVFQTKESIEMQESFTFKNRIVFVIISAAVFGFVLLSMVSWSFFLEGFDLDVPVSVMRSYLPRISYMLGVQGRYFIPFMPMLVSSLGRGNEVKNRKFYTAVQCAFYIGSMMYVIWLLDIRYWR